MRTDKKPTPFGRAVRMRLAALDMDQKSLAQKLGITPAYISTIIYNEGTSPRMVKRICEALDMPVKARWMKGA